MKNHSLLAILIVGFTALLFFAAACGGGGGGSDRNSDDDQDDDAIVDDDTGGNNDDDDSGADDDSSADDDTATDDDLTPDYHELAAAGQIWEMVHAVSGPEIYCADAKNNEVAVLDTAQRQVTDRMTVGSGPLDLDLNPAGDRLWVATSGATAVTYVDLGVKSTGTVSLNHQPVAVAVGGNGKVYLVSNEGTIEIVNEAAQTYITEVNWGLDGIIAPAFIEINRDAEQGYIANAGISPSSIQKFDLSTDDLTILEISEFGSLGSNGMSLTLAPDGQTIVFPCGSGNGNGYTAFLIDALDFSNILGEFDIGTYPKYMEYDPQSVFMAGINGDWYDERLYVMNPETFQPFQVIDMTNWINHADQNPPVDQDMMLLRANADGSVLVLYAEDTYNDLNGRFYLINRADLM